MKESTTEFFRIALLVKNVEEGTTAEEDMKTLKLLVDLTNHPWQEMIQLATFSREHLEGCINRSKELLEQQAHAS